MVTIHISFFLKNKETVIPFDEMTGRERGAGEACFLQVSESGRSR